MDRPEVGGPARGGRKLHVRPASKQDSGRMNQWKRLKAMIHGADVVVEVVDSRDVEGTRLPLGERWSGSKRLLVVANKADLLPSGAAPPRLQNRGISISAKESGDSGRRALARAILSRTAARPAKALFIGYPNVGKSSLINLLAGRKAAKVSAVAGTTKDIQWVRVSDELVVSDYRGMFPSSESEERLVRKGALNVQGDDERHAHAFVQEALGNPVLREWLEERFDIDLSGAKDSEDVLEALARRRGWTLKGGEPNLLEAARQLVRAMKEAPQI